MKTLVIHPKDETTNFLKRVYEEIEGVTLVEKGISKTELRDMVQAHERVMMMGHGSGTGLWAVGQFTESDGYIIDGSFVEALKEKSGSAFIWCNADQFVKKHGLNGFYTGMFISEVAEADLMGVANVTQTLVDESNDLFVETVAHVAVHGARMMHRAARCEYGVLAYRNPVARYNWERMYLNDYGNEL